MDILLAIIVSSYITFLIIRYSGFTKRSVFNNIVQLHLNSIHSQLEYINKLPYKYYVGETNDFVCEIADKISIKLRRKGFKIVRDTNEATCEVLLIS